MSWAVNNVLVIGLIIIGLLSLVSAIRTFLDKSPNIDKDSEVSKMSLSPYSRYWIARYYMGINRLVIAMGLLVFAAIFFFSSKQ